MVGRLVEQQQVGLAEQQLGQRDAHLPAAGEGFGRPFEVRRLEAEAAEHRRRLQLDAVAVAEPEAILQVAVAMQHRIVLGFRNRRIAELILDGVHLRLHRDQVGERARRLLEDGVTRVTQAVLRQVADGQRVRLEHGARIGLVDAGHHLEQRGLAGAVRSAQADAFAIGDLPRDVVEQDAVAEGLG